MTRRPSRVPTPPLQRRSTPPLLRRLLLVSLAVLRQDLVLLLLLLVSQYIDLQEVDLLVPPDSGSEDQDGEMDTASVGVAIRQGRGSHVQPQANQANQHTSLQTLQARESAHGPRQTNAGPHVPRADGAGKKKGVVKVYLRKGNTFHDGSTEHVLQLNEEVCYDFVVGN